MRYGISTACFYPMETERALQRVGGLGAGCAEIFVNASCELDPSMQDEMKRTVVRYDLRVESLHPFTSGFEPFLFFTGYQRRFQDGLRLYESFYRAADYLGARILVLHGDHRHGLLPEEEYFDRFGEMARHAARHGIILAQENVERCRSRDVGFVKRMRAYLGEEARFVLDLKQALRAGQDPFEMLGAMGKGLVHLHLSDSLPGKDCLPPGDGDFDFARLNRRLEEIGYEGCGMIELYSENYQGEGKLRQALAFLEGK